MISAYWVDHAAQSTAINQAESVGGKYENDHHFAFELNGEPYGVGHTGGETIDTYFELTYRDGNGAFVIEPIQYPMYNQHQTSAEIEITGPSHTGHVGLHAIGDWYRVQQVDPKWWLRQLSQSNPPHPFPFTVIVQGTYVQEVWFDSPTQVVLGPFTKNPWVRYRVSDTGSDLVSTIIGGGM